MSRKRDRPELVDLCLEEDSSEEEQPELGRQAIAPAPLLDHGYDSCDSEDLDSGLQGAKPGGLVGPEDTVARLEAGGYLKDESV